MHESIAHVLDEIAQAVYYLEENISSLMPGWEKLEAIKNSLGNPQELVNLHREYAEATALSSNQTMWQTRVSVNGEEMTFSEPFEKLEKLMNEVEVDKSSS